MENYTKASNNSFPQRPGADQFGGTIDLYKILFAIIEVLGIGGNVVVILTILRNRSMRSEMYYLLCNLAISDLLFAILAPFYVHIRITNKWVFGAAFCKIQSTFSRVLYAVSVMNLIVITVQRFRATRYPIAFRARRKRTARLIETCWALGLIISIPYLFVIKHETRNGNDFCFEKWPNMESLRAYYMSIYTILYILPLLLMACMYGSIFVTLRQPPIGDVNDSQQRQLRKRKEMSIIMGIIVLVFFITWAPWTVLDFIQILEVKILDATSLATALNYALLAVFCSTVVNPVVLSFMSSEFREGAKALFRSCSSCKYSAPVHVNTAATVVNHEIGIHRSAMENRVVIENTNDSKI